MAALHSKVADGDIVDVVSRQTRQNGTTQAISRLYRRVDGAAELIVDWTLDLRLNNKPPTLINPIIVNLNNFDPSQRFPGWDGTKPSQSTYASYPTTRDILVLGHDTQVWTYSQYGTHYIRGGRNVHFKGGTYTGGIYIRNFVGDACLEGVLIRKPFFEHGGETGDAMSLWPDASTGTNTTVTILNCRIENVDGFYDGSHGDVYQLPGLYPSGTNPASPGYVILERITGTTGYQGLFLSNQKFDGANYDTPGTKHLTALDVNFKKSRQYGYRKDGTTGGISLIYLVDMVSAGKYGDKPYPKTFQNVYCEPNAGETLEDCIFPRTNSGFNSYLGIKLPPIYTANRQTASYRSEMLLDGVINSGPPPKGDFAKAAGADNKGGFNVPGMGYISPGYKVL